MSTSDTSCLICGGGALGISPEGYRKLKAWHDSGHPKSQTTVTDMKASDSKPIDGHFESPTPVAPRTKLQERIRKLRFGEQHIPGVAQSWWSIPEQNIPLVLQEVDTYLREIIGSDEHDGCAVFDEFGHHGKDCDRPGGCIENLNRDELRAELRQRAGL